MFISYTVAATTTIEGCSYEGLHWLHVTEWTSAPPGFREISAVIDVHFADVAHVETMIAQLQALKEAMTRRADAILSEEVACRHVSP
jgi:hypothetical protein